MTRIRTLVVDDEEDMRVIVRTLIEVSNRGLQVAGEAVDGADALRQWRATQPDIIVLDERMPARTGLDVAREILREEPEQRIVLFSAFLTDLLRSAAEELGIRACLSKDEIAKLPETLWSLAAA